MIVGLGIDIVRVSRMARILAKHGDSFERRVFTRRERARLRAGDRRAGDAARVFAAKEAFLKSLDLGIFAFPLTEVEIPGGASGGRPAELSGRASVLSSERGIRNIRIDMAEDGDFAVAIEEGSTLIRIGTGIFGPRPIK